MFWNKKYNCCRFCGGTDWKHKGSGYCIKCSPLILIKEKLSEWTFESKEFITPITKTITQADIDRLPLTEFPIKRRELNAQIDARLALLKSYNQKTSIEPIVIEQYLQRISEITNNINKVNNINVFHGNAQFYAKFNDEQLSVILKDLALILINRRFRLIAF